MVVRKQKKAVKFRGRTTHGFGSRKKHRGAGSRGGRGRAGSGKRSGHKKNLFGPTSQKGFTSRKKVISGIVRVLNVGDLTEEKIQRWFKEGKVTKERDFFVVNLTKLGYGKLLGGGSILLRLKIIVPMWSVQAAEKIKAAGGEVISTAVAEA